METPQVPNPLGTDAQYDLLFRSYLNSTERAEELLAQIDASLAQIHSQLGRIGLVGGTNSRFPGGAIVHRVFRRLLRRHLGASLQAITEAHRLAVESIRHTARLWDDIFRHEVEMERRTRSGMLDRLAVVDALQIRQELLEEDLTELRSRE